MVFKVCICFTAAPLQHWKQWIGLKLINLRSPNYLGEQGWRRGGAVVAQWWRSGGAVVRALVYHQCVPGLIPGPGVICGLSLLLVLVPAPRVFSRFSGFPPSSKTNISKFQFDREFEGHGFISWRLLCVTLVKQSWVILFYFIMEWSKEKYIWLTFLDLKQFSSIELHCILCNMKGKLLKIVFFFRTYWRILMTL